MLPSSHPNKGSLWPRCNNLSYQPLPSTVFPALRRALCPISSRNWQSHKNAFHPPLSGLRQTFWLSYRVTSKLRGACTKGQKYILDSP